MTVTSASQAHPPLVVTIIGLISNEISPWRSNSDLDDSGHRGDQRVEIRALRAPMPGEQPGAAQVEQRGPDLGRTGRQRQVGDVAHQLGQDPAGADGEHRAEHRIRSTPTSSSATLPVTIRSTSTAGNRDNRSAAAARTSCAPRTPSRTARWSVLCAAPRPFTATGARMQAAAHARCGTARAYLAVRHRNPVPAQQRAALGLVEQPHGRR